MSFVIMYGVPDEVFDSFNSWRPLLNLLSKLTLDVANSVTSTDFSLSSWTQMETKSMHQSQTGSSASANVHVTRMTSLDPLQNLEFYAFWLNTQSVRYITQLPVTRHVIQVGNRPIHLAAERSPHNFWCPNRLWEVTTTVNLTVNACTDMNEHSNEF